MLILHRSKCAENEKCPICRRVYTEFGILDANQLFCLDCGAVFIKKQVRDNLSTNRKELLEAQESELKCVCGFVAKTKAGLVNHKRGCDAP